MTAPDLGGVEAETPRRLCGTQSGIWFAQRLAPASPAFNVAAFLEIHGPVDRATLERALGVLVDEADSLHVGFVEVDGEPLQRFAARPDWRLRFVDVSSEPDPWAVARTWMDAELATVADLSHPPLFAFALIKLAPAQYLLYQRCHHIITDAYSGSLATRRIAELYTALLEGRPPPPQVAASFRAFLDDDQRYRSSAQFESDRRFWLQYLEDRPAAVSLSNAPAAGSVHQFRRHTSYVPPAIVEALTRAVRGSQATLSQMLIGATSAFLSGLSPTEELLFSLAVANRGKNNWRIPGPAANVVPIRITASPRASFFELLQAAAQQTRAVLRHQRYRREDMLRDLGLVGRAQHPFGPTLNIIPYGYDLTFGGHAVTVHNLSTGPVEDLSIVAYERADGRGLRIDMDGNIERYDAAALSCLHRRFLQLLERIAADPSRPLGCTHLLSPAEHRQVLEDWSGVADGDACPQPPVAESFERQAATSPDAVALVFGDQSLTYAELNARANRLADSLIARGVGPEMLVAIAVPRSAELVVSLLAILKTGAAYLPLDPDHPNARLTSMLEDARPVGVLATAATAPLFDVGGAQWQLDVEAAQQSLAPADNPSNSERLAPLRPENTAYVIYTSGSTGQPKGVIVRHGGLTSFMGAMRRYLELTPHDRLLAVTTLSFDIAALELLLPLIHGATVVIAPRQAVLDPAALGELVRRSGATLMQATPTLWAALVNERPEALRGLRALVGGEALPRELAQKLAASSGHAPINLYGPTEATIWSTAGSICSGDDGEPVIGRPLANTQAYVKASQVPHALPRITTERSHLP